MEEGHYSMYGIESEHVRGRVTWYSQVTYTRVMHSELEGENISATRESEGENTTATNERCKATGKIATECDDLNTRHTHTETLRRMLNLTGSITPSDNRKIETRIKSV